MQQYLLLILLSLSFCAKQGMDVSRFQYEIDWKKAKEFGMNFAILRAGVGTTEKDKNFDRNYKLAKENGMEVGIYWHSNAKKAEDGIKEAQFCMEVLKGGKYEYPIYYAIEEESIFSGNFQNQLATNFCGELEKNKYFCGIMSDKDRLTNNFSAEVKSKYVVWVAQWDYHVTYKENYGMWQYTCKGEVDGINTRVCLDYVYVDYPSIIKKGHFNGY